MTFTTHRPLRTLVAIIVLVAATGLTAAAPAGAAAPNGITIGAGYASSSFTSPIAATNTGDWRAAAFNTDGSRMFVTGGVAGVVKSIPTGGGSATTVVTSGTYLVGLGVSPDGAAVYSALRTGNVVKQKSDGSSSLAVFGYGTWIPEDLAVSPAGSVYVITTAGEILRWSGAGTNQTSIATVTPASGRSIAISSDGTKIAFGTASTVGTLNIDGTGATTLVTGLTNPQVAFGPDGSLYYGNNSGSGSQSVIKMNADGSSPVSVASGFSSVTDITVDSRNHVYVQDFTRSDIVELLPPPVSVTSRNHVASGYRGLGVGASKSPNILYSQDFFNNVATSADGRTVFAATDQGYVIRMTPSGYDQAFVSTADNGWITDMVLSPDGSTIYAAAPQVNWIVKFSTTPGGLTRTVKNIYPYAVESLAMSPDGTKLYLAAGDRILQMNTDGTSYTTLTTISGSGGSINSIASSPDGSTLYAGGTGAVWSINVASTIATKLSYTPSNIAKVSVLPDGHLVVLDIGSGTKQNLYVLDANLSNPTKLADGTTGSSSLSSVFTDAKGDIFLASADASAAGVSGFIELQSTLPAAPTGVTATGSGSTGGPITVSWTAPTDTGGSALTGFTVTASTGDGTCTAGPSATSCTIGVDQGLSFGASVSYRVTATNPDGSSVPSAWSAPLVEYNNPQAPGVYSAAKQNARQVYMTWGAPGGGSPGSIAYVLRDPITNAYDYTTYTSCWCAAVFGPFPAGHSYTFDFYATTVFGNSAAAQVGPFNFPGAPTAPTGVTAVPGDRSATVSWTPYPGVYPAITSYAVTASPGGATCSYTVIEGGTNSCVVTGLTAGSTYTFSVVPTSSFSGGAAADSAAVEISTTVPSAPTNVTGVAHDSSVDVSWDASDYDGGLPITGYWAQAYTSSGELLVGAVCSTTGTACSIAGLTNDVGYKFSVRATNDNGYSDYATRTSTYTPKANTVPSAPTGVTAVPSAGAATVSWTASTFDGGLAISGYWAQAYTASGTLIDGAVCPTTDTTCTISGLSPATTYQFSVRATNDLGYSEYADRSSSITTPGFTSAARVLVVRGVATTVSITTTGLPDTARSLRIAAGTLPSGVTFTNNGDGTGQISGTAKAKGRFAVTIVGGEGFNEITQEFTLYAVVSPSIVVTGANTKLGRATTIRITTSAGGFQPALSATGLPSWATFVDNGNGTGKIIGTPDVGGSTKVRVTANGYPTDSAFVDVEVVVAASPIFTSSNSITMTRRVLSSFTIQTSGGYPTPVISLFGTSVLPAGLALVDNADGTATISGTPTTRTAKSTFWIQAISGVLSTKQKLSITVN